METTLAQIAHEMLGIDVAQHPGGARRHRHTPYLDRHLRVALDRHGGRRGGQCLQGADPALGHDRRAPDAMRRRHRVRFENGAARRAATPIVDCADVAEAWYLRPDRLPPDVDLGGPRGDASPSSPKRDTGAFSYASHAAAVAVDPDIGQVEILDYVIVEDCGTLVNPMVVDGQTLGGAAQGIGTAMYEESPYDANGQPLASTLRRLPAARADRSPGDPHLPHRDAVALHRVRHQGHGRRRRDRAAGGDLQRGQRRAAAARRRSSRETPLTPRRLLAAIERAKAVPTTEAPR